MTLHPFEHYVQLGTAAANDRWAKRMKFFLIAFAAIGLAGGLAYGKSVGYPVIGALAGILVGYGIFRAIVYVSASSTADDLYRVDWCAERGMKYIGDDYFPPEAPYATSGDRRRATDAYEGEWNGLTTLFYNFTYTDEGTGDDPDTDYDFKIMRLTGREIPIGRLTIQRRSGLNKFAWADKLQGAFTSERPVSLESVAFNEKFDLTIDDDADDVWIRRIFDPATIQGMVDGSITMPDIRYYNFAWWIVEKEHFATSELEQWVPKQLAAANAVTLLSRVQTL